MADLPTISIVTPSFNQAAFLEDTICSVLGQNYPNLEYIVLDANSTDGSVEIIRRYESKLAYWHSQPDGGQAAAINFGFSKARGDILGWLNSDDMYLPGTLRHVAGRLQRNEPGIIAGNCVHIRQGSSEIYGSDVADQAAQMNLRLLDYLIQPSSFWTRAAWEKVGPLNESLCYTLDWDWFVRAADAGVPTILDQRYLSVYRLHEAHKTATGSARRLDEIQNFYDRYSGPAHAAAFARYRDLKERDDNLKRWLVKFRIFRAQALIRRIWLHNAAGGVPWSDFMQMAMMTA